MSGRLKQLLELPVELQLNVRILIDHHQSSTRPFADVRYPLPQVLIFLPAATLLTLTTTSRSFRILIQSHPQLLYIIELKRYGLVDCWEPSPDALLQSNKGEGNSSGDGGGGGDAVVGEKLQRLREREENWGKLRGEEFVIEMEEDT